MIVTECRVLAAFQPCHSAFLVSDTSRAHLLKNGKDKRGEAFRRKRGRGGSRRGRKRAVNPMKRRNKEKENAKTSHSFVLLLHFQQIIQISSCNIIQFLFFDERILVVSVADRSFRFIISFECYVVVAVLVVIFMCSCCCYIMAVVVVLYMHTHYTYHIPIFICVHVQCSLTKWSTWSRTLMHIPAHVHVLCTIVRSRGEREYFAPD